MTVAAVLGLLIIVGGFAYTSEAPDEDNSRVHICIGHCQNTMPKEDDEEPCDDE